MKFMSERQEWKLSLLELQGIITVNLIRGLSKLRILFHVLIFVKGSHKWNVRKDAVIGFIYESWMFFFVRPHVIHLCLCIHLKNEIVILLLLDVVICACSENYINNGFMTLLFKVSFFVVVFLLLQIRFHHCPVECVLQTLSWRCMEIDASRNGVSWIPDFEGERTGKEFSTSAAEWHWHCCCWTGWLESYLVAQTSHFTILFLEGSNGSDWVTNNFIVVNWIKPHSQVCEWTSCTETQDFWKLSCEFIQVYLFFLQTLFFFL